MANLHLKSIRKTYPKADIETLKGIDIQIDSGEFLILVGPSGCGKSTLMNTIAGLEDITGGEIKIDGRNVEKVAPKDRDIAMVFQSYALYPNMTVRGNIAFGLEMKKMDKADIDSEVERVAEMLQIEQLLDRKPSQLSGGQRQRVAMGRALARRPKLYLFDEPLSNLDAKLRVDMRHQIKRLHQQLGTTIVYVTHDQIEAMTLADRIAVMRDGELQQLGTPAEIYNTPSNMFVAGFMGSPSMNFVQGVVDEIDDQPKLVLRSDDGAKISLPLPTGMKLWKGKEVVMGVRPEHVEELSSAPQHDGISGIVEVLEPTGPDTIAMVSFFNQELACRLSPDSQSRVGETLHLKLDLDKVVLFDANSEKRIELS